LAALKIENMHLSQLRLADGLHRKLVLAAMPLAPLP
jgi:hypothetical protein